MNGTVKLVRTGMLLLSLSFNQCPPTDLETKRIQEFRRLSGRDQVHMLLHQTSIFRKVFTTDFQNEEEIVVASSDSTVNSSLAAEARHGGAGTAREAVFVLCERARFVRSPEFPLKVPLDGYVRGIQGGLINPFLPDFDKIGKEAAEAVREALNSSNAKLRTTANIYCGGLEHELALMSANELVARWRAELGKLAEPLYAGYDSSETGELVRVLKRALAEKGLESATEMSLLLDKETRPWARENEIKMIEFLDGAAVRLRGSQHGRDVIQIVERTLANKQLRRYKSKKDRQEYWKRLQDSFFKDDYTIPGTAHDHWAGLIGLAFDQYYGEHVLISTRDRGPSFSRANEFMTYLTNIDPAFPSWEFASTLSEEDMFHPKFAAKMARYHAIWVQMNVPGAPSIPNHDVGAHPFAGFAKGWVSFHACNAPDDFYDVRCAGYSASAAISGASLGILKLPYATSSSGSTKVSFRFFRTFSGITLFSSTSSSPGAPSILNETVGAPFFRAFCERMGSILSARHI